MQAVMQQCSAVQPGDMSHPATVNSLAAFLPAQCIALSQHQASETHYMILEYRVVTENWKRQLSRQPGVPVSCWLSSPVGASIKHATCQTRTPVNCGTALRWSAGLSRTPPMICAEWSMTLQCRLCLLHRTWRYKPPLDGYACMFLLSDTIACIRHGYHPFICPSVCPFIMMFKTVVERKHMQLALITRCSRSGQLGTH